MKLQVIIGSTRQGRVSDRIAHWVAAEAKNLDDTTVEVVDLIDYEMPFFDEPVSPQYNPERKPKPEVKKWLDKVASADAYVLIVPEYNRSAPAVLKNALDYLDFQLKNKPVAVVAHGSSGGAQAVASLRAVLAGVKSFMTPSTTYVMGRAAELIDESGELVDEEIRNNPYGPQAALQGTLSELQWYSDALAAARAKS
jgi:NAD(P)H-dependent FMN reductase